MKIENSFYNWKKQFPSSTLILSGSPHPIPLKLIKKLKEMLKHGKYLFNCENYSFPAWKAVSRPSCRIPPLSTNHVVLYSTAHAGVIHQSLLNRLKYAHNVHPLFIFHTLSFLALPSFSAILLNHIDIVLFIYYLLFIIIIISFGCFVALRCTFFPNFYPFHPLFLPFWCSQWTLSLWKS